MYILGFVNPPLPSKPAKKRSEDEHDNGGAIEGPKVLGEVKLAKTIIRKQLSRYHSTIYYRTLTPGQDVK